MHCLLPFLSNGYREDGGRRLETRKKKQQWTGHDLLGCKEKSKSFICCGIQMRAGWMNSMYCCRTKTETVSGSVGGPSVRQGVCNDLDEY